MLKKDVCMLSTQSCPTLCNLINCSLPSSSIHRILWARILKWVAMSSSRRSSQPWDWTHVLCLQHWHVSSLPLTLQHCQRVSAITLQPRRVHCKSCRGSISAVAGPSVHFTHWICHCCCSQVTPFKFWAKLPLPGISPETFILSVYSWNKYLGWSVILSY